MSGPRLHKTNVENERQSAATLVAMSSIGPGSLHGDKSTAIGTCGYRCQAPSLKILHQHQVAAGLILLRIQNVPFVRGDRHAPGHRLVNLR